jgi:7,8-dihydropterin-6-yl-methyl-4-(beta-D-ribofuranosyl)aminobenzene 5'-phosphate synthase
MLFDAELMERGRQGCAGALAKVLSDGSDWRGLYRTRRDKYRPRDRKIGSIFQCAVATLLVIGITAMASAAQGPKEAATPPTGGREIAVTTVSDNYSVDARLTKQWGFAAVISTPSSTVLFDTGPDTATLLSNMKTLGIDPRRIDKVVISHIHTDHIGGLPEFLRTNANVQVFFPGSLPEYMRRTIDAAGARHQEVGEPTSIAPGIHTTGLLGTSLQEQALVVETGEGLVVIAGCAHPGIVSVVRKARAMSPKADVAMVMGGFHLLTASLDEVDEIVRQLRELGVQRVAPSHCTGDPARSSFKAVYGTNYADGGAGLILKFAASRKAL